MDFIKLFILLLCLFLGCQCQALCQYPKALQNKVWMDSIKGTISYSDSIMTGWNYNLFTNLITEWECYLKDDKYVTSRSKDVYPMFGEYNRAYLCQDLRTESVSTYYYYLMSDKTEGERVYVTSQVPLTVCEICSPKEGPGSSEYYVMSAVGNVTLKSNSANVGCNPCLNRCDVAGTPAATTVQRSADNLNIVYEKGPPMFNKNDDVIINESSDGKLIGGLVAGILIMALVAATMFWLVRRGWCVTNILGSFYEKKEMNPF